MLIDVVFVLIRFLIIECVVEIGMLYFVVMVRNIEELKIVYIMVSRRIGGVLL